MVGISCMWRDKNKESIRGYYKGPGEIHWKSYLKQVKIQKSEMPLPCPLPLLLSLGSSPTPLWRISVPGFWVELILPLWRSHVSYHRCHHFSYSLQIKLSSFDIIDISLKTSIWSCLYTGLTKCPQSTWFTHCRKMWVE